MRKSILGILLVGGVILSSCSFTGARAVDSPVDVACSSADLITVLEAIAENPPAGNTIINLEPNCEYVLDGSLLVGEGISVLPVISSYIIINGNQATLKLIKDIWDPPLRVVEIDQEGSLALNQLTITTENTNTNMGFRQDSELGGAIFNEGVVWTNEVLFSENFAVSGGAIYNLGMLFIDQSRFEGNRADDSGGAIYSDGVLILTDSLFSGNETWSRGYGGAVYQKEGELTITDCNFVANKAKGSNVFGGGAIAQIGGTLTVSDSLFDSNQHDRLALTNRMGQPLGNGGGALYLQGVQFSISGSDFLSNQTDQYGGAISSSDEEWIFGFRQETGSIVPLEHSNGKYPQAGGTIQNCTFSDNQAEKGSGAIHNLMGNLEIGYVDFTGNWSDTGDGAVTHGGDSLAISYSTFDSNQSLGGSPIINLNTAGDLPPGGPLTIDHSSFTNNHSAGSSPMLLAEGFGVLEIHNSLFAYNDIPAGTLKSSFEIETKILNSTFSHNAGPLISTGTMEILSSTIAFNSAEGVIFDPAYSSVEMTIQNTIVAENSAADCVLASAISALGANLDSDSTCSGFSITADPKLETLGDYGGLTLTHALQAQSPAIDAGTDSCPQTDQRDEIRQTNSCDVGAYELGDVYQPSYPDEVDIATLDPEILERCKLFDLEEITLTIMAIPPGTTRQTLYLKIPAGVPGLEVEVSSDSDPWEYTAELGLTSAEGCSYQGYEGRLYCSFILPESVIGTAQELSVYLNGCTSPIFTHPRVTIFEPTAPLICSAELDEEDCLAAGGDYKEAGGSIPPVCDCP